MRTILSNFNPSQTAYDCCPGQDRFSRSFKSQSRKNEIVKKIISFSCLALVASLADAEVVVDDAPDDANNPAIELSRVTYAAEDGKFNCIFDVETGGNGLMAKSKFSCHIDFDDLEREDNHQCDANQDEDVGEWDGPNFTAAPYKLSSNVLCSTDDRGLAYRVGRTGGACTGSPSVTCKESAVKTDSADSNKLVLTEDPCDGDEVYCQISIATDVQDILDKREKEECHGNRAKCRQLVGESDLQPVVAENDDQPIYYVLATSVYEEDRDRVPDTGVTLYPQPAEAPERIVFVTDSVWQANLGGIQGADQKCQEEAMYAGYAGNFRAWISTITSSPATDTNFSKTGGPFVLPDFSSTVVADDWQDLTTKNPGGSNEFLKHPINYTPKGITITNTDTFPIAWTNTTPAGYTSQIVPAHTCQDWTDSSDYPNLNAIYGGVTETDEAWTYYGGASCNLELHLYCFQQ